MATTPITLRLTELCSAMRNEKDPKAFEVLVKEMTHLLAVQEMDRLLEAAHIRLQRPAERALVRANSL
jgi:hypothetical protein